MSICGCFSEEDLRGTGESRLHGSLAEGVQGSKNLFGFQESFPRGFAGEAG